jgi:hypothetical protein
MTQGGFGRRLIALVGVLALHFLFLLLLLARGPSAPRIAHGEHSSVLFFIEAPQPRQPTVPPISSRATQARPTVVAEASTPEQTSSSPTPTNSSPAIDWAAQAADAAAVAVDKAIREETRKCDPSDQPHSFLPPCNPRTKKFEWNPEQPRVGFSGGLPYVRLGKRCAVGLGFFGCGLGDPPPANGELFEGMDDPERERSSVPSSNPPDFRQ